MKTPTTQKQPHTVIVFFLAAILAIFSGNIWAVGPVDFGSVPGGATLTDSDGGSGEQWGRAGGRDLLYEDFVIGNFSYLNWQPLTAGMAFDGEISGGTNEEMSGPVVLDPFTLQWTGQTTITNDVSNSTVPVYTRFTVVASAPFNISPENIDIIAAGGSFTINLLFEASEAPGGPYQPALNFFDNYPTPPGHDGFAHTSFSNGFFFEGSGMTLEEHDTNMHGRFDNVDGALDFLTIESVNRLTDIGGKVHDNGDKLTWIKSDLETLLGAGTGNLATTDDIDRLMQRFDQTTDNINSVGDSVRDRFSETDALILCAWIGNDLIPVCPPGATGLPNLFSLTAGQANLETSVGGLNSKVDGIQGDLDALVAGINGAQHIDVSVESSDGKEMFTVLTSVNGLPTDAEITAVTSILVSKKDGTEAVPALFTAMPVTTGVQGLEVEFPGKKPKSKKSSKSLLVEVELTDGGGNTLHGSILINDQ